MMKIRSVQIFKDNYSYIIQCTTTGLTAIVDPAEPEKVIKALESDIPSQLLTTHHHADHSMGNKRIKKVYSDIRVFGGDDRIPGLNIKLKHNDVFNLGELEIKALITAGHTTGHVCYYAKSKAGHGAVFTGDTLFIGGCGRFFEGNGNDMYQSLKCLSDLPDDTLVYCGHEYTQSNLEFAANVEPLNLDVLKKLEWAKSVECTLPSTIGDEKKFNPFMRVDVETMQVKFGIKDPVVLMDHLRTLKNKF